MYRERYGPGTIFIASVSGRNIHDSVKGWGTISPSGKTILWKSWPKPKRRRKLSPEQEAKHLLKLQESFRHFVFPTIKNVANAPVLTELFAVQPTQHP